jgi:membrane fusion protein (multidrug efflux system)
MKIIPPLQRSLLPGVLACLMAGLALAEEEATTETEVAVQVAKIRRATLRRAVTAYGNIEPEPLASARLAPAVPGIVAEVNAVEGQQVEKGAVIFRLDSRAADAAVAKAQLAIDFAQKNADRQNKLIAAEGTSEKLVLEAQQALAAARTELATAKVQQSLLRGDAPIAGTLVQLNARPGEAADATTTLAEIIDLERLVANVRVPQADAVALRVGQKNAEVLTSRDATGIETNVIFIGSQVDPATGTVLARLAVPKTAGLRPGQFVQARLFSEELKDRLAVPVASVVTDPEEGSVIAIVEAGKATRRKVKTGLRDGDLIEVEGEGVVEGQNVVTVGAYGLPKETKVRVVGTESK